MRKLKHVSLYGLATVLVALTLWVGVRGFEGSIADAVTLIQVNTTSVQTLTNKTLTAPVLTSPTITGTTTIGAGGTLTSPTLTSPTITGTTTIGAGATITSPTLSNPTFSGTAAGTLTNLSLITPTFPTIVNTGTLTLPTTTDTLVGRATTDTLTNKTLTSPSLSSPSLSSPALSGTVTGTYTLGGTPTLALTDANFTVTGSADTTKQLKAEVDGNAAGIALVLAPSQTTTQTLTIPNLTTTDTLVTTGLPQTITGVKTLTNPTTAAGTTALPSLTLTGGTNLTTAIAGAIENDAVALYGTTNTTDGRAHIPSRQHFRLTADGANITTIANYFGSTSNISLVSGATYYIEIFLVFTKTTAEALTITLTNTAAPTSQNIVWQQSPITGLVAPPGTATMLTGYTQGDTTAALAITTGSLTTAVKHWINIKVELTNATGTSFKIQATNPAGSITPLRGSYWTATRIPIGNTGTFVN